MLKRFKHDNNAKLDYVWNWQAWLEVGETITTQTVTSSEVTTTITAVTQATGKVTAWVQATKSCVVTCHIVTSTGREDDRSIFLEVISR